MDEELFFVTTSRKASELRQQEAQALAKCYQVPYLPRRHYSLAEMQVLYPQYRILLLREERTEIILPDGETLFFHPGLAEIRRKRLEKGEKDRLIEAMQLRSGMRVLDCTLGLAADALVLASIPDVEVVGIEASFLWSIALCSGLKQFASREKRWQGAISRLQVLAGDHMDYLRQFPKESFDVVYFDPMFRHGFAESSAMNPLRALAKKEALTLEAVKLACGVAKRRVILKENARSREFARLGFIKLSGGRYSKVAYGSIEK